MSPHIGARCIVASFMAILAFGARPASAQELVMNGGFETGDFSNWSLTGAIGSEGVDTSFPHSGNFAAFFGPFGNLEFMDQVLGTTPGQVYNLSFSLMAEDHSGPLNEFLAQVDGMIVVDQKNVSAHPYQEQIYSFTAATTTTDLSFGFRMDPQLAFWDIDDISVQPKAATTTGVPEPGCMALLTGTGVAGIAFSLSRRRHRQKSPR